MKTFIKILSFIVVFCSSVLATHFDQRIGIFQNHQTFEKENPDVIFAGYPGLNYRCYTNGSLNSTTCNGNYFKWMLDLKYDLDVAENQCNWRAKEMISKELLETIGGKYGLTELDTKDDIQARNEIADFQNMAALHAAIAMEQMAVQRKTTEIMKKHIHLSEADIRRVYTETSEEKDIVLDRELEEYLLQVDMGSCEFKIEDTIVGNTKNHVNDIRELANILNTPDLMKGIIAIINSVYSYSLEKRTFRGISELYSINGDPKKDKELYIKTVTEFIDDKFNFKNKEFLRKLTIDYLIKIYEKIEHILTYNKESVKLKLRDCNGADIFGNVNVFVYDALLELLRSQKENLEFVSVGGMYNLDNILEIAGEDPALAIIFKRFYEDKTYIVNNGMVKGKHMKPLSVDEYVQLLSTFSLIDQLTESLGCYNEKIRKAIMMYGIKDGGFTAYSDKMVFHSLEYDGRIYQCVTPVEEYHKIGEILTLKQRSVRSLAAAEREQSEAIVKYEQKDFKASHGSEYFIPTNDLSSRIRTKLSYIIWQVNKIRHIKTTSLLKKVELPVISNVTEREFAHRIPQKFFQFNEGGRLQVLTVEKDLTPLRLLQNKVCDCKLDSMLGAIGLSNAVFNDYDDEEIQLISDQWPEKRFFNEITGKTREDAFAELLLSCFHVTNPFSAIVGVGYFKQHPRLVLQYN